ncbi:MAG: hypothetical protein RR212_14920, partial [Bacteroidales bacterium]
TAVLRDAAGNIAHWALTESVDPYGNWVRYEYNVVNHSGVQGSDNMGQQIYPSSIDYTGFGNTPGEYRVNFNRRPGTREDVTISGRYGFKEVSSELLCNVQLVYKRKVLCTYLFEMERNRASQYKNRLNTLVKIDSVIDIFDYCDEPIADMDIHGWFGVVNKFEYYDAPSGNAMFGGWVEQNFPQDNIESDFLTHSFNNDSDGNGKSTALGSTKGKNWSLGGTLSVGVGFNICMTSISVGGNFDYSESSSEGLLTMIDLDGDGLSDKVFKKDNKIYYRKQIPNGEYNFSFGAKKELIGISDFLKESSMTTTWGLQASAGMSYSGGWPATTSTTSSYFSDVNADGLPDLITEGGVMFNSLNAQGVPEFRSFYSMVASNIELGENPNTVRVPGGKPCESIIFDGEVNDSIVCHTELLLDTIYDFKTLEAFGIAGALADSLLNTGLYECVLHNQDMMLYVYEKSVRCIPVPLDPDMDAVKVWVAPKSGYININSDFRLLEDTSASRRQSKYVDGVRYTIQCNRGNSLVGRQVRSNSVQELYNQVVLKDDYNLYSKDTSLYIQANDILFFRLQSQGSRLFDKVNWEQTITYTNSSTVLDEYGVNGNRYHSQEDFLVTGREFFQAHKDGIVHVTLDIKTGNLSKDAILYMYYRPVPNVNIAYTGHSILLTSGMDSEIDLGLSPILAYDSIQFLLASTDIHTTWSNIQVSPKIDYIFSETTSNNNIIIDTLTYYPSVNYLIFNHKGNDLDNQYHQLFGPLYRGWGQFSYHNNDGANSQITDLIDIGKLIVDEVLVSSNPDDTTSIYSSPDMEGMSQESASNTFDANGMYAPLSSHTRWVEMKPNTQYQSWVGYGNINYMNRSMTTNTRLP